MSLISGLFTLPFGYAIQAYKQTCYEPRLSEDLKSSGNHIKDAIQPFLEKIGLKKDLTFIESPNIGFCLAFGTNMSRKNNSIIIEAPGFYEADKDACIWLTKHEISHIKNNDNFTSQCVPAICQLAASIYGMISLSFIPAVGIAYIVGITTHSIVASWRENKADDFAIKNSSDEELKGGLRFLKAIQEANLKKRNTFWNRIIYSANGENRFDILHPSLTSRIQKIEKILCKKSVKFTEPTETLKLEHLKGFVINCSSQYLI